MRRVLLFMVALLVLYSKVHAQSLSSMVIPANAPPPGCQSITGLYPVGDRTAVIWDYKRYAVVMPLYKKKQAQSFVCDAEKGTLYFFEYKTAAEKDRALLFAKPVLAKQNGLHQELPIKEWATGFVVVSFPSPPSNVMHALDDRIGGNKTVASSTSITKSAPVNPPTSPSPMHGPFIPEKQNVPVPASTHTPVPVKPVLAPPAVTAVVPASSSSVKENTTVVTEASGEPFAQMKPSIAADPFAGSETSRPMQPVKPAPPALPVAAPPKPEPVRERPRAAPKPMIRMPAMKALAAPPVGTADLSSSVLESYASKMGCESTDRNAQTQMVCSFMQEFASGLPPEMPLKPSAVFLGPAYTVDTNGRFTELFYDGLAGTQDPAVVSFFRMPSDGGKDDFEIKQLVEARKAKTPLPQNDSTTRLAGLIATKPMGVRKTAARSVVIQPINGQRFFIRRAGDHLVVMGVSGDTFEQQKNASLIIIVLY